MSYELQTFEDIVSAGGSTATKLATAARAAQALKIAGITLSSLGIVLDAITIGVTMKDVKNGSKSKLAQKLRYIAMTMEQKLKAVDRNHADRGFENSVCMV